MMRLEMKKYKTILTEKQQKYLPFTKEILPSNWSQIYIFFFMKSFGKTNGKTGWCFKVPKPFQ